MMLIATDQEKDTSPSVIPPLESELNSYGFPRGYFMLRSAGSQRVLDLTQGLKEDGTPIILWPVTETSLVDSMRRPECDNQVFFIDTSGALCSRSAGHAVDVEGENLVLRHRRPVVLPFPNAQSHTLPRFVYHPETKEITVTFAADPFYPQPDAPTGGSARGRSGAWKEKTYYLSSVPARRPPTLIDNASTLLTNAMSGPLAFFGGNKTNATPEMVFDGEIDLSENEIAEQDRNEAEEVDDSPDALRQVKAIGLTVEEAANASSLAKLRCQWEIQPLRATKLRTGRPSLH